MLCTLCSPIFSFNSLNIPSLAVQDRESNPFELVLVRTILVVNELFLLNGLDKKFQSDIKWEQKKLFWF